jgi:hypothetical protein
MEFQPIILRRKRDFGETISDTIQFLKRHIKNLFLIYLVFVTPFLLLATLFGADSISAFFSKGMAGSRLLDNPFEFFTPMLFLAVLLYLCSSAAYGTAVYLYIRNTEEKGGRPSSLQEVGARFLPKFISNAGYLFITMIGFVGLALFAIIPFLGILIVMVAVFYALIALSLLYPVNTTEDPSFPAAFYRVFKLIRNRWWYTFGVVIVFGLIYYFFAAIIGFVVNTIMGFSAVNFLQPASAEVLTSKKYLLTLGISSLIQQIFSLIVYVGIGIHYFSLREEKDGGGLEARIDQLGSGGGQHGHIEEQY